MRKKKKEEKLQGFCPEQFVKNGIVINCDDEDFKRNNTGEKVRNSDLEVLSMRRPLTPQVMMWGW